MTIDPATGPNVADLAPLYAHMGAAALDAHMAALIAARAAADGAVDGLASALKATAIALEEIGVEFNDAALLGLDEMQEAVAELHARRGDRAALARMELRLVAGGAA